MQVCRNPENNYVLSCLGNLNVARIMCLSYYSIAMEVIKGFPSLPVLDKQFLVM